MVTLTPSDIDHAIQQFLLLSLASGFLGALLWDFLQAVCVGLVSLVGGLIDRKGRIKRSRERAASLRRFGERAVKVADRMDAREDAKSAVVDQRQLICRGKFPEHLWDADVRGDEVSYSSCVRCGQDAFP